MKKYLSALQVLLVGFILGVMFCAVSYRHYRPLEDAAVENRTRGDYAGLVNDCYDRMKPLANPTPDDFYTCIATY